MIADIYGLDNVLKYIQATKLTRFIIHKAGTNSNYLPVFESLETTTTGEALTEFSKWAEVVNQNQPYKISLFNKINFEADETGEIKVKKSRERAGKTEATFIIDNSAKSATSGATTQHNQALDIGALKADLIREIAKEQQENAILNEIKSLKEKFAELEEEEEEEEEESAGSIAGISPDKITQILGLVSLLKNNGAPATINGEHDEAAEQKRNNINEAIKRLYKHNKQLDTDLLKLAEIAEKKPDTFNMLLTTLRNF